MEELLSLKWDNHKKLFMNSLPNLRIADEYTDITLTCDGRFYNAHKLVLSVCSDYFKEIFRKSSGKSPLIVLMGIRHEYLEMLLDYMYIGEINVKQEELHLLIKSAEDLKIKGLAVHDYDISGKENLKRKNISDETLPSKRCMQFKNDEYTYANDKESDNLEDVKSDEDVIEEQDIKDEYVVAFDDEILVKEEVDMNCDESQDDISNNSATNDEFNVLPPDTDFSANPDLSPTEVDLSTDQSGSAYGENSLTKGWRSNSVRQISSSNTGTSSLQQHPCTICGKLFKRKYLLMYHSKLHTKENPFKCRHCTFRSRRKENCILHMIAKHSDSSNEPIVDNGF